MLTGKMVTAVDVSEGLTVCQTLLSALHDFTTNASKEANPVILPVTH